MSYRRTDRLNQLLREELARLVRRGLKDPRVRTVTVTDVHTTPDLMHATVYVRTLDDEISAQEAVQGLERAAGFIRRELGRELRLRRIPEFRFEVDRSLERVSRIETLLDEVRDDARNEEGGEDTGRAAGGAGANGLVTD